MSVSDDEEEIEFEEEHVTLRSFSFGITTVSHMPIHILMRNHTKGVEISGQKIWCGSLGVCEYLMDHSELVLNKIVIELGAGTGLLGMLCRRLGATSVFLTDNDPRSLEHMRLDTAKNSVSEANVVSLDWYQPSPGIDVILQQANDFPDSGLLIVAGDVLYKKCLLQPFFSTVRKLMQEVGRTRGVQMLLCHIPRADVTHDDVTQSAIAAELTIERIDSDLWMKGCATMYAPEDDYTRAMLYSISGSSILENS